MDCNQAKSEPGEQGIAGERYCWRKVLLEKGLVGLGVNKMGLTASEPGTDGVFEAVLLYDFVLMVSTM